MLVEPQEGVVIMMRFFALLALAFAAPVQAATITVSAEMTKLYDPSCAACPETYVFSETGETDGPYYGYNAFDLGKFHSRVVWDASTPLDYTPRLKPVRIIGNYSENGFFYAFEGRGTYNGDGGYLIFAKYFQDPMNPNRAGDAIVAYRALGNVSVTVDGQTFAFVPEPSVWALLIIGFGTIGMSLRRRSTQKFALA